ncbi:MAG TPA: biotin/lipoyl-containing protein, partial [Gemmatimonadales bacterium]|nr:biotin/lipoyl-containing protein [Gemmatimonadales bacterium]
MKYTVTVGGQDLEVEVDGRTVRVDGRELEAHLSPVPGVPLRHLLLGDQSHALGVQAVEPGVWRLLVDGVTLDAVVVDERTRHIRSLTGAGTARSGPPTLKAPMPGLVLRVLVQPGQAVTPGQGLLVLEAMKMENELRATAPGTVKAVLVTAGEAVDKG